MLKTGCVSHIWIHAHRILNMDVSGQYRLFELYMGRPTYKHRLLDLYLFCSGSGWKVDTGVLYNSDRETPVGFIRSNQATECPDLADQSSWQYYHDIDTDPACLAVNACNFF